MFPHTSHCELIVYFERVDLNQLEKIPQPEQRSLYYNSSEGGTKHHTLPKEEIQLQ
jgi:hypothetical protein